LWKITLGTRVELSFNGTYVSLYINFVCNHSELEVVDLNLKGQ